MMRSHPQDVKGCIPRRGNAACNTCFDMAIYIYRPGICLYACTVKNARTHAIIKVYMQVLDSVRAV